MKDEIDVASEDEDSDSGGSESDPFDGDLNSEEEGLLHGNILNVIDQFNQRFNNKKVKKKKTKKPKQKLVKKPES